jgi:hypothetical protein
MTELEGGVDISLFNNRASLGVSLYDQAVKDLVVNQTLASSTGGSSIVTNVGEMSNKGYEIALGITPIKNKNLNWDMNFIYNHNDNLITKLGAPFVSIPSALASGNLFLIQGQPASVYYGNPYARWGGPYYTDTLLWKLLDRF